MAKVLGVGGIFFKSPDTAALYRWYEEHLGMKSDDGYGIVFKPESMPKSGVTIWSPFKDDTKYMDPSGKDFMFNLIVDDLDAALKQVEAGGATLAGEPQRDEYGQFGWFIDPDGNKVELWQPPEKFPGATETPA